MADHTRPPGSPGASANKAPISDGIGEDHMSALSPSSAATVATPLLSYPPRITAKMKRKTMTEQSPILGSRIEDTRIFHQSSQMFSTYQGHGLASGAHQRTFGDTDEVSALLSVPSTMTTGGHGLENYPLAASWDNENSLSLGVPPQLDQNMNGSISRESATPLAASSSGNFHPRLDTQRHFDHNTYQPTSASIDSRHGTATQIPSTFDSSDLMMNSQQKAASFFHRLGEIAQWENQFQSAPQPSKVSRAAARAYYFTTAGSAVWRNFSDTTRDKLLEIWELQLLQACSSDDARALLWECTQPLRRLRGTQVSSISANAAWQEEEALRPGHLKHQLFDLLMVRASENYQVPSEFLDEWRGAINNLLGDENQQVDDVKEVL